MATPAPFGPLPDKEIYKDLKAAKAAPQEHAGLHGYSITVAVATASMLTLMIN
jgi:hypothetical protein